MISSKGRTAQQELPASWKWVTLGDVAQYVNGRTFNKTEWAESGLPIIRIQNLNNSAADFNYFDGVLAADHRIENGDLLVSWSASLDVYIWDRGPSALNQHIFKVLHYPEVIAQEYLFHCFRAVMPAMRQGTEGHGATMHHITKSKFQQIHIPLPPLEEQKRIAGILNQAGDIKKLREEADKKTEELIPAIFHEMVGSRTQKGEELPAGWKWVKLGDVCEVKGGKRLPKGTGFSEVSTGFRYIRVTDFRTGSINIDSVFHISPEIQNTISSYTISSDDLYISIAGTIGLVGRVPYELSGANLTENAAKIVIKSVNLNLDFLVEYLRSAEAQAAMVIRTNTMAQPKLALERIRTIPIPLPPLEEQKRIADRLNGAEEIQKTNAESDNKIEELQSSLLQRAFRGEL